jgi:4-alpha-glucanotransferase
MALFERKSGVLLHISSLPSKYGIGDLGPQSRNFASLLKESNQTYWQILPLTPLSSSMAYSPYASSSAFAGNTLLISPDILYEKGLLKKSEIACEEEYFARDPYPGYVDFTAVCRSKNALLDQAYQRFLSRKGKLREGFEKFCARHGKDWLDGYAFFKVIKASLQDRSWNSWPDGLRDGDFSSFGKDIEQGAVRERFFQYLFFDQWHALKNYCNRLGIKIIGDVPIYVDYESADVWMNTQLFKLDNKKSLYLSQACLRIISARPANCGTIPSMTGKSLKKRTTAGG